MMHVFRKHANGPIFKALMLLLALAFVLWGVGDVIRGGNKQTAFKVGDAEISVDQWQRALASQVAQIEQEVGRKLEPAEVNMLGVRKLLLNQLVNKQLLLQESKNLHLLVSDDMVKYEISAMPSFYKDGKFDKETFVRFLRNIQMSEEQFISGIKEDIVAQNVILSLTLNKEAPKSAVDSLLKARGQAKLLQLYKVDKGMIDALPLPKEEELKETYEQFKEGFSTEETRDFAYTRFSINDIKDDFKISDEELKESYDSKKVLFSEPEKRQVKQMIFKDEQKAALAASELASGKSFEEVAKHQDVKIVDVEGYITSDTFDKDITKEIFVTKKNAVTKVVKTPLGFHIFFVKDVIPGKSKEFDEVKQMLLVQLKDERKYEALSKLAQDIEEDVSHGLKLRDITQKYFLKMEEVQGISKGAVGDDKKGKFGHFIMLFSLEEGAVSSVTPIEGQNDYYVAEVTKVNSRQYMPFESVRDKVEKLWKENKTAMLLYEKAKEISQQLKDGKAIAIKSDTIEMNWFDAQKSALPQALKAEISRLDKGEVTMPIKDAKEDMFLIAKILDIKQATLSELEDKRQMVEYELASNASNEILSQYFNKLRQRYDVKVINIGE